MKTKQLKEMNPKPLHSFFEDTIRVWMELDRDLNDTMYTIPEQILILKEHIHKAQEYRKMAELLGNNESRIEFQSYLDKWFTELQRLQMVQAWHAEYKKKRQ